MPPDLNSLPPSRSPTGSPLQSRMYQPNPENLRRQTPSPSPRSSSVSLAAAATINAGIQNEDSRRSSSSSTNRNRNVAGGASPQIGRNERRRSTVMMNLSLNDPGLPGPGELQGGEHRTSMGTAFSTASPQSIGGSPTVATGDPHHQRAPSLGEIHQELEQEQEAQVNRLLQMIRQQEAQLQQIQQASGTSGSTAVDDSTPTSDRSFSFPTMAPTTITNPRPRSPAPRSSFDLSRQPSRRSRNSSRTTSPALRPVSASLSGQGEEQAWSLSSSGNRDESAFYQAETQNLTRENQMLRFRIRELERQLSESNTASVAHTPSVVSNLTAPPTDTSTARTSMEGGGGPENSGGKDD
ncbi:MAG: hypothetical protein M1827_005184 [Pycnora praestabilis]|nr:MAG: hypothetical protein M1827_005184 [Pycnora praestabilis]